MAWLKLGPFLGWLSAWAPVSIAMRYDTGVTALAKAIKLDPQNPFRYYWLAQRYDALDQQRAAWRRFRAAATLLHSEAVRAGVRTLVRFVDGKYEGVSPQVAQLLSTVALTHRQLRFDPSNDSLQLLLGAASFHLAVRTGDEMWGGRAVRALSLVVASSTNRYRVSDAAVGLAYIYMQIGHRRLSRRYRALAHRLGNDCVLIRGGGSGKPSIWDVGLVNPREVL